MRGLFVPALGMKQVSHGKDGEIHGENQTTHDEPKQYHQQRFNQGKQAANRPAQFFLMKLCGLLQHMLELSGFFTESDHSLQRLREAGLGSHGILKSGAVFQLRDQAVDRTLKNSISTGIGGKGQGFVDATPAPTVAPSVRHILAVFAHWLRFPTIGARNTSPSSNRLAKSELR